MQYLYRRKSYPKGVAAKIEAMGAMAVSVANRWMLGWPGRVKALLKAETYLEFLEPQVELEKNVLAANKVNFQHLAYHEILEMCEITPAPPVVELLVENEDD